MVALQFLGKVETFTRLGQLSSQSGKVGVDTDLQGLCLSLFHSFPEVTDASRSMEEQNAYWSSKVQSQVQSSVCISGNVTIAI
jgi:hypothetical protein